MSQEGDSGTCRPVKPCADIGGQVELRRGPVSSRRGAGRTPVPRALRRPATQYLRPGIPGFTPSAVYPVTPDLAKARTLASRHGRTAVIYACEYAACRPLAQTVRKDLADICLRVEVNIFDHNTLHARLATPNQPFDIAFGTDGGVASSPAGRGAIRAREGSRRPADAGPGTRACADRAAAGNRVSAAPGATTR